MNELITQDTQGSMTPYGAPQGALAAGRQLPATVNAGTVAIEQERAIAEVQGKILIANRFPRDLNSSFAELMQACRIPAFAKAAFFSKPQGGGKVTGASIRLAEEIARVYRHMDWGSRELSRVNAGPGPTDFGRSEVEVFVWDMQHNNYSRRQIAVQHVIDTKEGPRKLRDQTDIDNKIANVVSKQVRGRILALVPKWLLEAAIEECRKTLAGENDEPIEVRVRKMTQAFSKYGVNVGHLERYLGHGLDSVTTDELVDLMGVFTGLKDGDYKPSEVFGEAQAEPATTPAKPEGTKAALAAKPTAKPLDAPATEPAAPARSASTRRTLAPKPVEETPHPAVESMPEPTPPADDFGQEEDAF